MGVKNIILIIVVLLSTTIQSQKRDSLKPKEYYIQVNDTIKSPSEKLSNLETLLFLLTNEGSEKISQYLDQYIELAIELKQYNDALRVVYSVAIVLSNTGTFYEYKQRIFPILKKGEPLIAKVTDSLTLGNFYGYKGYVFDIFSNNFKESIRYYELAFKTLPKNDTVELVRIYRSIAPVYAEAGYFLKAANAYRKAEVYHESAGEIHGLILSAVGLAKIYGELGFYDKEIEKYLQAIELGEKNGISIFQHSNYYSLALVYSTVNDLEKYKEAIQDALKLTLTIEDDDDEKSKYLIYIYGQLANYYFDNGDIPLAEKQYRLAEDELKKRKEKVVLDHYIPIKLEYLFKTQRYNEAIVLGEKALTKFEENKNTLLLEETHQVLYKIYEAKGNTQKALKNHIAYASINDSINNVTKSNTFNYYQELYETEKKEKEIVSQSNKILLLDQKNKAQNTLILFLAIGSFLVLITVVIFIKRRQLLKEKKLQQEFSRDLLMTQEQERKRISEDLHDGLGQSLLVVKNEITLKHYEKSKELLNSSIEEMRTIARSLYPFQLNNIGIGRAIDNLIVQLNDSNNGILFFTEIDVTEENLSDLQRVNIFRIVQECLSNIIKHAKADSARVALTVLNQKATIVVQDNGVGFDFSKKYNTINTLGLKTIQERASFLNGILEIDSKKEQGTVFSIVFPITS